MMKDFSRRDFLAGSCAAVATSVVAPAGSAQTGAALLNRAGEKIGLGFSLYGMMMLKIEQAIEACAKIGYDCVELPVTPGWEGDSLQLSKSRRKQIRRKLADTGVRLSALMENLRVVVDDKQHRSNLVRLKAACGVAHDLAPDSPAVIETVLGGRSADWEKSKHRMIQRLHDWAKIAEATKTTIAIKAHVGGAMHRPEHPVWLAGQVNSPWIRCAYDYSHFELRGIDMATSVKQLVPQSVFIHIKDSRGDPSKVQFLLPGQGNIDYLKLLKMIVAEGYRGDIFVEVSAQIHRKAGYDPLQAARQSYEHLAPVFQEVGIVRG